MVRRNSAQRKECFLFFDDALADCIREFVLENEEALIEKFRKAMQQEAETSQMIIVTSNDKTRVKNWLETNHLYQFIEGIL